VVRVQEMKKVPGRRTAVFTEIVCKRPKNEAILIFPVHPTGFYLFVKFAVYREAELL
jgi:hypothetical protein